MVTSLVGGKTGIASNTVKPTGVREPVRYLPPLMVALPCPKAGTHCTAVGEICDLGVSRSISLPAWAGVLGHDVAKASTEAEAAVGLWRGREEADGYAA